MSSPALATDTPLTFMSSRGRSNTTCVRCISDTMTSPDTCLSPRQRSATPRRAASAASTAIPTLCRGTASATGWHLSTTALISPTFTPSYTPVMNVQRVSPSRLVRLSRPVNGMSAVIFLPSILTAHEWLGGTSSSTETA
ncbi:hypothetical protein EYF80_051228 [Liparis tanakae]|uniref:Uncharacterized protein n=1 Tax=Liparis tanakae TaxID=230148 RepID=A0A4Z2FBR7_9TELE|nr:hypothetical protein EYF80_051228 [Liparis tanakae]